MKDVLYPLLSFRILVLTARLVDPVLLSACVEGCWRVLQSCWLVAASLTGRGRLQSYWLVVASLTGRGLPHR